ncbi:hypothetical protein B0H10DRAFT_1634091, partial [Mycena sp. CBHHK59/15]
VCFQVEDTKFKVHRHFLMRDSVYFQELFAGPLGEFGRSESEAIPLESVGSKEFECLLDFFYNGMYDNEALSLKDWTTLLAISTRLQFPRVRAHAIRAIDASPVPLDPVEQLVLAAAYDVPAWRVPAYAALCRRPACLTEDEAERLGLRATVRIARVREAFRDE